MKVDNTLYISNYTSRAKHLLPGTIIDTKSSGPYVVLGRDKKEKDKYHVAFINSDHVQVVTRQEINNKWVKDKSLSLYRRGYLDGLRSVDEPALYTRWYNMLTRCYSWKYFAAHPWHERAEVHPEFLSFRKFVEHAKKLPGYEDMMASREPEKWSLDKDIKYTGEGQKIYGPDTCCFVPTVINSKHQKHMKAFIAMSPDGEEIESDNIKVFATKRGLDPANISKVLKGERKQHKGWTFKYI